MGKRVNPALVGAFVLGAIGVIVTAVVVIKGFNPLSKHAQFVIYFEGDVSGLEIDAPVKLKGVTLGEVKKIHLDLREGRATRVLAVRIPVIIQLDQDKIQAHGAAIDLSDPHQIPGLVREGLYAQLASDSLVTGVMYVKLDITPPAKPLKSGEYSPLEEIPSVSTTLEQAQAVAVRIFERLDKVDFDKVFKQVSSTLDSLETFAKGKELSDALTSAHQAMDSLNNNIVNKRNGEELSDVLVSSRRTLDSLNAQITPLSSSMQTTFGTVQTTIEPRSPVSYQVMQTLHSVDDAARSIKELADYLQRNPSAIVRGRDLKQEQR